MKIYQIKSAKNAQTDAVQINNVRRESQALDDASKPPAAEPAGEVREIGGPKGPEPTRYGDWERKGRCFDF